jgi:hypothetical protein
MPPRWGFLSFRVGGYNDVAPTELKNDTSADSALNQWAEVRASVLRN